MQVIGQGGGVALGRSIASSAVTSCLRVIAGGLWERYAWMASAIRDLQALVGARAGQVIARTCPAGRSRSPATTLFFEAEILVVNEVPNGPVVHLQPAIGQLGHKSAQREISSLDPLQ